ncbi:MAG: knotted carbamoyltransferase YgeW [Deltaproteobacteria bacterium]|nr:knotted carbamoyltransferase YgeW [Deltaproteobacteria bacterium]
MKHPTVYAKPDKATLEGMLGKSLLCTQDFSDAEIDALLAVATTFEQLDGRGVRCDVLPAQLAYAVFFDNSTRTKSAWAGAAARLGMHPVIVDGSSTQIAHGETAWETGAMLGMNAHALGVRHDTILGQGQTMLRELKGGIDAFLRDTGDPRAVPVVNLQCDVDHPTQALADLQWLRQRFDGSLRGKKIAISWAYSPSYAKPLSVPQGEAMLLSRWGAEVVLAHPPGYDLLPETIAWARDNAERSGGRFAITHDMDEAFAGADVVYPKSWGPMALMQERVAASADKKALADIEKRMLAQNAAHTDWICDERRMALTREGKALYLHCLPADIGAEVSPGVMERARLDVACEAHKKVYVIMAALAVAKVPKLWRALKDLHKRG